MALLKVIPLLKSLSKSLFVIKSWPVQHLRWEHYYLIHNQVPKLYWLFLLTFYWSKYEDGVPVSLSVMALRKFIPLLKSFSNSLFVIKSRSVQHLRWEHYHLTHGQAPKLYWPFLLTFYWAKYEDGMPVSLSVVASWKFIPLLKSFSKSLFVIKSQSVQHLRWEHYHLTHDQVPKLYWLFLLTFYWWKYEDGMVS